MTEGISQGEHRASSTGRFLHVVPDDKFIDEARAMFEEVLPGAHDYVLLSGSGTLKYLRTFEPSRVDVAAPSFSKLLPLLPGYKSVFVHYLNDAARLLVDKAPPCTRLVWIGWGGDYYHLIKPRDQLLLPETRTLMTHLARRGRVGRAALPALSRISRNLARPIQSARRMRMSRHMRQIGAGRSGERRVLDRFALFAPVLREEYDTILTANVGFQAAFAGWNYWTAGLGTLDKPSESLLGQNLLLGNSATPENNHLEAMRLIAAVEDDRRIICPLSYGNVQYGDRISSKGAQLFGDRFLPLRGYMDTATYVDVLHSCSIVAMNHVRQQAMGNIIMMLWLGARVFLNRESPVNGAMASIGIDVHDIRGLPEFLQQPAAIVDMAHVLDVRERLVRRFGRTALLERTRELIAQASALPAGR